MKYLQENLKLLQTLSSQKSSSNKKLLSNTQLDTVDHYQELSTQVTALSQSCEQLKQRKLSLFQKFKEYNSQDFQTLRETLFSMAPKEYKNKYIWQIEFMIHTKIQRNFSHLELYKLLTRRIKRTELIINIVQRQIQQKQQLFGEKRASMLKQYISEGEFIMASTALLEEVIENIYEKKCKKSIPKVVNYMLEYLHPSK